MKISSCINNIQNNQISLKIHSFITNFVKELEAYYSTTEEECVFELTERPFLGLFNNAIIRNDINYEYATLQEYSVISENKITMRPDLLLLEKSTNQAFIIESKHYYASEKKEKKWTVDDSKNFFNKTLKQAKSYYENEEIFYEKRKSNVYLCALIFDSVKEITNLKTYLSEPDDLREEGNYFCYTIIDKTINDKVLNVYGVIKSVEEENK